MENRVKFEKGLQRAFLDLVVDRLGCVSVRGILQFGFEFNYSSLKNYYTERRMIPIGFFKDLCHVARINLNELDIEYVKGNFGQAKGGKTSKRLKKGMEKDKN
jgi:hypothetical protein